MVQKLGDFFARNAPKSSKGFRAEPWFNPYGDSIHFHWRDDEFYGDRIDDKLTVYRSIASREAVGCEIKGVTALQKKLGDWGISLQEKDGTPLAMFLFVSHATASESAKDPVDRQKTYQYLLEQVGKQKVALEEAIA